MSFISNGDLKFFYDGNPPADIALTSDNRNLIRDPGLETAVLISLFSDQQAGDEDVLPSDNKNRRGWWGDILDDTKIGSKIWLLGRSKINDTTVSTLKQYTEDALEWLTEEGVADTVEVACNRNGTYQIDTIVKITKANGLNIFFKFYLNWKAQIFGRI